MKFGIIYNSGHHGTDPDALIGHSPGTRKTAASSPSTRPSTSPCTRARASARSPSRPTCPIADPLECLSFVAAVTERILLGTGVLLLPYHQPVVLAKRLATIDLLSKGRMRLFSIGVGALPGEAAAVGVDYATRGRRADESIDALRLLWAGDENGVSFDGEFVRFTDACSFPKPTAPAADPHRRIQLCRGPPGRPAAATAISPAAGSPRPNRPARSSSCGPPPGTRAATRTRWRSPAGDRST